MADTEDFDAILEGLSYEDLQALSDEIDPEHELMPVSERSTENSSHKFDIGGMIREVEKMSVESIEGDNYLPLHARNWKPPVKKKEEPVDTLPDEWNEALDQADEKEMQELAGILGVHSVLTQEQSSLSEKEKLRESLRELSSKPAKLHYEPSQGVEDHYGELQQIDVSALFRRLKSFDKELTEITLNNMKEIDDVLLAVADFLEKMDCVTKISVANTKMSNHIGTRFAEALKKNSSLIYLNMESNYLSGEVIVEILDAIENNTTLTELKVANQSKTAGAQSEREMVKRLDKNHCLRKFGYAFQTPGIGNTASRLILRNNDEARKARLAAAKK